MKHEYAHLYDRRWRKQRAYFLQANPLCVMCQAQGFVTSATVVDHIKPHRGDLTLFWDANNWQSLCKHHHDSAKQAEERSGVIRGGNLDGEPIDPAHHWRG
jgi:5-methylcytosine-specific restriction protein A